MAVTFRELKADGSKAGDEEPARGTDTETKAETETETSVNVEAAFTRQGTDGDALGDQASDRRELDERTLRQQVAILERLVRAERRRNQVVIDHYERVLEEREAGGERAVRESKTETKAETETESLLERVLSRLG
ncbi:hypothetical protein [Natronosalvus rutilus]|uniref:Uncharacterized protein n=1 Tax=Natronosalvus rutilus TaxID=2953753 RepID=A0A9E7SU88_9EURY|nr:hypothetical protein [Natronosalvus rutilus]UTF54504.1 hypothetical protein NGM29_04310 [Natronosalvus rutilus]